MEELVIKAQRGDKQAFSALIQSILLNLYRIARSVLKRECDCSDAIQETILQAYLGIHRLKQPASFKAWIIRILLNQSYKILNNQKKLVSLEDCGRIKVPTNEYEQIEIRELLDHLEEGQRIVLGLYYFEKCSIQEIAEILQIPEGTVKSRMHRGKQALERMIIQDGKRVVTIE